MCAVFDRLLFVTFFSENGTNNTDKNPKKETILRKGLVLPEEELTLYLKVSKPMG